MNLTVYISEWHSEYEKTSTEDFVNRGDYEYYSVMHFPWAAPDTDPTLDAFYIKKEEIDKYRLGKGENGGFTALDVLKIQRQYECPAVLTVG